MASGPRPLSLMVPGGFDAARAHAEPCDILSPCALGATLDATTIDQLACAAVVGSANNQLATEGDTEQRIEAARSSAR